MKSILTILALFTVTAQARDFSGSACISSTTGETFKCPSYINECAEAARANIEWQASRLRASLRYSTFAVEQVDDRALNPIKYVWFTMEAQMQDGSTQELRAMTQKAPLQACF